MSRRSQWSRACTSPRMTKFTVAVVFIRGALFCSEHTRPKIARMEKNSPFSSKQSTSGLLEKWEVMLEGVKKCLARAGETATLLDEALSRAANESTLDPGATDSQTVENEAENDFELRLPRTASTGSSTSNQDASDSFKLAGRSLHERTPAKLGMAPRISDLSEEMPCSEMETSMDLLRRRKSVHEIPQIVINTPEGADRFRRRRSTGEPRTPRMQLSCVNSPGTPSAHMPRTPIPLVKQDTCTPDSHYHPSLVGGSSSCRKREISTTDNGPVTPPHRSNAVQSFSQENITELFTKMRLVAPRNLNPPDDSKGWESDMNAAFYSAFKLIAAGMDSVQKGTDFYPPVPPIPSVSASDEKSTKPVMTAVLEDVLAPLEMLMNNDANDDEKWAEQTLASAEKALLVVRKQVPLESYSTGYDGETPFFKRRVGRNIDDMSNFMRKANNKITDEMRRACFLDPDQGFGGVAAHVSELLRAYNEAICQLDYMSSSPSVLKKSYDT